MLLLEHIASIAEHDALITCTVIHAAAAAPLHGSEGRAPSGGLGPGHCNDIVLQLLELLVTITRELSNTRRNTMVVFEG